MMQLTEEQKKALIHFNRVQIATWEMIAENEILSEHCKSILESHRIALATLTAQPISVRPFAAVGVDEKCWIECEDNEYGAIQHYTAPPVAAMRLPEQGSDAVNEAAWLLHDLLGEGGPLTGRQFNNLKGNFYKAMKVAMGAPAEGKE